MEIEGELLVEIRGRPECGVVSWKLKEEVSKWKKQSSVLMLFAKSPKGKTRKCPLDLVTWCHWFSEANSVGLSGMTGSGMRS